jgi:DNA modification methylase
MSDERLLPLSGIFHTTMIPAVDLIPYARNPRKNTQAVDRAAASIHEFGWRVPIVVDEDMVILAGHTRLEAARKMGLKAVPVHIATDLTEAQKRAFRIMDNRSAQDAEWDDDLLAEELADLIESEYDLGLTGFEDNELAALLADKTEGHTDEDAVPEPTAVAVSRPGDVWTIGLHRVVCGDATDPDVVQSVLAGIQPHLMVTDPPYGVNYDPSWRADAGVNKNKSKMGRVKNDDRADWREAWELFPGDVAYVWHASLFTREVLDSLEACGFAHRSMIIWAKDRFTLGRGDYHWQHEPAWYVVRDGKAGHYCGGRSQSTVWNIPARDDSGHGHGTQKPVECMRRPILNNSSPGQAVYDPFLGSGTTIIAAETEGRQCLGCELDPIYVDVIIRRWQEFTGEHATLEDGTTFAEREAASDE